MKMTRTLLALAITGAALALNACSGSKDLEEPVLAPAVDNRFDVKKIWHVTTGYSDRLYSQLSPVSDDKVIYAPSRIGWISALSMEKGRHVWMLDLSDEEENDDKRFTRLSGGLSYQDGRLAAGTENGWLYFIDAATGKLIWKKYLNGELTVKPAFSQDSSRLFVVDARGRLYALSTLDGTELWSSGDTTGALQLRSHANPVAVGDSYVVVGTPTGRVQVFDQSNGNLVNQITVGVPSGSNALERVSDVSSTPVFIDDVLYAVGYSDGLTQYSLRAGRTVNRLGYHSARDLAFDDNIIVLTDDSSHVHGISRVDNSELWVNTSLTYRNVSAPVIYGNYAVVGDMEGFVYFLNLANGVIECKLKTDNTPIYAAPQVVGSALMVFTANDNLYLFYYDPQNNARFKAEEALAQQRVSEPELLRSKEGVGYQLGGMGQEELLARRAQAQQLVNAMEARQREAERQMNEYRRRKAEYEKQKAEYERRQQEYERARLEEVSGFGIMPGVKSEEGADE